MPKEAVFVTAIDYSTKHYPARLLGPLFVARLRSPHAREQTLPQAHTSTARNPHPTRQLPSKASITAPGLQHASRSVPLSSFQINPHIRTDACQQTHSHANRTDTIPKTYIPKTAICTTNERQHASFPHPSQNRQISAATHVGHPQLSKYSLKRTTSRSKLGF